MHASHSQANAKINSTAPQSITDENRTVSYRLVKPCDVVECRQLTVYLSLMEAESKFEIEKIKIQTINSPTSMILGSDKGTNSKNKTSLIIVISYFQVSITQNMINRRMQLLGCLLISLGHKTLKMIGISSGIRLLFSEYQ